MLAPCLDEVENLMTKNQTIEDITTKYLDNELVINSPRDILKIPGELTEKINAAFDEHNVICAKDEKWKKPDVLEFAQVALILLKVFIIKLIHCSKENNRDYDLLGVYVDDTVIKLIPSLEQYRGIYITQEYVFRELARLFSFNIKKRDLSEMMDMMKDKAVQVERCQEQDYIAVGNGIFNYATKQLMSFSPDLIFMCKSHVNYNSAATNVHIHNPDDGTDWDVESWMQSLAPDSPGICNTLWEVTGAILRPNVCKCQALFSLVW